MSFPLRGSTALVTGAASGIGRATALALASRGCHLALVDRDEAPLAQAARLAREAGVRATEHLADLADAAAVKALPGRVLAEHERVAVLVNNAGVSLVGRLEHLSMEEARWLMEINFFAVVGLTRALLPHLLAQPAAQVVNLSSLFGLIAPAEQTLYAASKFAVRGFSEALRHELEGTGVGVTVVHPGGVRTAIAHRARVAAALDAREAARSTERFAREALRLPPERAGEQIARAVERRQGRLLIGADARGLELLQRAAPAHYWALLRRGFQRFRLGGGGG